MAGIAPTSDFDSTAKGSDAVDSMQSIRCSRFDAVGSIRWARTRVELRLCGGETGDQRQHLSNVCFALGLVWGFKIQTQQRLGV
jgi:hypothetical protein